LSEKVNRLLWMLILITPKKSFHKRRCKTNLGRFPLGEKLDLLVGHSNDIFLDKKGATDIKRDTISFMLVAKKGRNKCNNQRKK
jgi:hypothetical protein